MEEIKFNVKVGNADGSHSLTKVTMSSENAVSFINSVEPIPGEVAMIEITTTTGTLSGEQLQQAKMDGCFIKLSANGEDSYFKKYLEANGTICFAYVVDSDTSNGSTELAQKYIAVNATTGAYELQDGELADLYSKGQIDSCFTEVTIQEG